MDPNQPTPTRPDYSFINEQPGFETSPKPKTSKKTVLLFVVGFLALSSILGSFIFSKVQVKETSSQAAREVTKNLFSNIAGANADAAYSMFREDSRTDKQFFTNSFVKPLSTRFKFSECQEETAKAAAVQTGMTLYYLCPIPSENRQVEFKITVDEKTSKVLKFEMVTRAS